MTNTKNHDIFISITVETILKGVHMNKLDKKYMEIIESWIHESKQQQIFLENDDRLDEANLEKIRCNIYEIFQQMFQQSKKTTKTEEDFIQRYLSYHQNIPANWKRSHEQAKEQNSIDMFIEETKIEAATKVEQLFRSLWCKDGLN